MSKREDVQSLIGDPSIASDLRAILAAASDHEPSGEDIAHLAKRLAAVLPPGALPPTEATPGAQTSPTAAKGMSSVAAAKVIAAIAIAGAIGGAVRLTRTTGRAIPGSAASSASVSDLGVSAQPASTLVVTLDAASPPIETGGPLPLHSTRVRSSSSPPALAAEPEASMLARAHEALLHGSPDRALAIAGDHARVYPRGMLVQEREVIAIEALVTSGRRDEARARAAAFRAAYPDSSHRARLERLVEGP